jgi:OmcA/MtrC family decaheme c-type cytochrome
MQLIRRGLLVALAAGAIALPSQFPTSQSGTPVRVDGRGAATHAGYTPKDAEFYLTPEQIQYIRPGFNIAINSVTIGADNKPVVDLSFTDDFGQPLDRLGNVTPGALSVSFVIAWLNPDTLDYTSYITTVAKAAPPSTMVGNTATQATSDSGGTWTDIALGHSTYKFGKALPTGFDQTKTTTLGLYATRNLTSIIGKNYYANVEDDFRPDGQPLTSVWNVIDQSKSCNTCHDPISAHGGSRMDVKLCALCHNPQTVDPDTGNSVDLKVFIHKIHDASNLPSVKSGTPYVIIGHSQAVNDFSGVVFPQDIRNCTKCHDTAAAQSEVWYTHPSRAACGSCHDDINWATGANHPAGPQLDDSACADCHVPQGEQEYDASIKGAHTVPTKSAQLKGFFAKIVSVANTAPGQNPTVKFQLTNGDGSPINPSTLGSNLNLLLGGPTTDYAIQPFRENASKAAFDGTTATYTFTNAVPADATGTWAVAIEARRTVTLNPAPRLGPATVTEGAFNPVTYIAVTDPAPVPRRQAVTIAQCNNACHDQLALHGGQRFNTEECVMCHNPNGDDSAFRPADQLPVESIDFKRLIHRIHSGENLTQNFTIYGFNGSVNNFNDVLFPGDRRDCVTCHVAGAYQVSENPPAGLLPTTTKRDYFSPMQHYTAACLGCHDAQSDAAHAYVNVAPFGEACAACHGNDAEFSVDQVHAR